MRDLDIPQLEAQLLALARQVGAAVLAHYETPLIAAQIQHKQDESPLTAADLAAHQLLTTGLPKILALPVLSEESLPPDHGERRLWEAYWLVDPLDGTKEFLQRNGQFTVNIALIHGQHPLLGLVHLPVGDETWFGWNPAKGRTAASPVARKYLMDRCHRHLSVRSLAPEGNLTVLTSARHGVEALAPLLGGLKDRWSGAVISKTAGSSLKFCWLAEGKGDLYPRLSPTMEWDSAAAHAILAAAGGAVIDADAFARGDWQSLVYNKSCLTNPPFYAIADLQINWRELLA